MATRTKKPSDEDPEPEKGAPANGGAGAARPSGRTRPPARTRPKKPAESGEARSDPARSEADRRGALSALASGLGEIVPGIEIVDRDLRFDEGGRADLAGVDPSGRLYLVLVADGEDDRIVLDALDARAFADRNAALLARHLGRKRTIRSTQVLVICLEASERLYERFVPLLAHGVGLYRVRTLRSASGDHSYLVPWGDERRGSARASLERFLATLGPERVALVHSLIERLKRIDSDLRPEASGTSLVWHGDGEELVRLEVGPDGLDAYFLGEDRPHGLSSEAELEDLTEGALTRLVSRWGGEVKEPSPEAAGGASEGEPALDEPTADPLLHEGPILTPEEIDAFRG